MLALQRVKRYNACSFESINGNVVIGRHLSNYVYVMTNPCDTGILVFLFDSLNDDSFCALVSVEFFVANSSFQECTQTRKEITASSSSSFRRTLWVPSRKVLSFVDFRFLSIHFPRFLVSLRKHTNHRKGVESLLLNVQTTLCRYGMCNKMKPLVHLHIHIICPSF